MSRSLKITAVEVLDQFDDGPINESGTSYYFLPPSTANLTKLNRTATLWWVSFTLEGTWSNVSSTGVDYGVYYEISFDGGNEWYGDQLIDNVDEGKWSGSANLSNDGKTKTVYIYESPATASSSISIRPHFDRRTDGVATLLNGNTVTMTYRSYSPINTTGIQFKKLIPNNQRVTLEWTSITELTPPVDNPKYIIEYSSDNGASWTRYNQSKTIYSTGNPAPPIGVVFDLTNGVSYIFRIGVLSTLQLDVGTFYYYSPPSSPVTPRWSSENTDTVRFHLNTLTGVRSTPEYIVIYNRGPQIVNTDGWYVLASNGCNEETSRFTFDNLNLSPGFARMIWTGGSPPSLGDELFRKNDEYTVAAEDLWNTASYHNDDGGRVTLYNKDGVVQDMLIWGNCLNYTKTDETSPSWPYTVEPDQPTTTTPPTTPQYTVSVTPRVAVSEGGTITVKVDTRNVTTGTILYWTVRAISGSVTASDFENNTISGEVQVIFGTGNFTLTLRNDFTTEGNERFKIELRTDSVTGSIVAESNELTIIDTSISTTEPVYFFNAPSSVSEDSSVIIDIETFNVTLSTLLYYEIKPVGVSGVTSSDFTPSVLTGTVAVGGTFENGSASLTLNVVADLITEGAEYFTVEFRTGSSTGTLVGQTTTITIVDTPSTTTSPSTPIIESFLLNKQAISPGETAVLSWIVTSDIPTTVTINNGIGSVSKDSSVTVNPTNTTTYIITATNSNGTVTSTITLTVYLPTGPEIVNYFPKNVIFSNNTSLSVIFDQEVYFNPNNQQYYVVVTNELNPAEYTYQLLDTPWVRLSLDKRTVIVNNLAINLKIPGSYYVIWPAGAFLSLYNNTESEGISSTSTWRFSTNIRTSQGLPDILGRPVDKIAVPELNLSASNVNLIEADFIQQGNLAQLQPILTNVDRFYDVFPELSKRISDTIVDNINAAARDYIQEIEVEEVEENVLNRREILQKVIDKIKGIPTDTNNINQSTATAITPSINFYNETNRLDTLNRILDRS